MRILVCDDRPERCQAIADEILETCPGVSVHQLSGGGDGTLEGALERELRSLFSTVGRFIPPTSATTAANGSAFDGMDIVVLDNNLSYLNINGARLTAESIAGYIRAFTTADYLVSLNKNSDVDFDLRHLVGDRSTRADIALNTEHLSNGAIWGKEPPEDGFAPWYWPNLGEAVSRRRAQIEFVKANFDRPALAALDLAGDAEERLSRRAIGRFRADGQKTATDVTFRDLFSTSTRSIPDRDDRAALATSIEKTGSDIDMLARIVAADLDLWFRSEVLGAQDVLVDAAHLVARMPFLIEARASDPTAYDHVATAVDNTCGLSPKLFEQHVADTQYPAAMWSPRPVFRWDLLSENDGLAALFAGQGAWADVVFCEDLSRFKARDDARKPREFVTDMESPYERRYVAGLPGKKYVPASRFAI